MSVNQDVFTQLKDMGIDAPLARAAAQRFSTADAAVNWCFGEGINWTPQNDTLPTYDSSNARHDQSNVTVTHHEVMSPSASRQTSPQRNTTPFAAPPRHPLPPQPPAPPPLLSTSTSTFASASISNTGSPPPPPPRSNLSAPFASNNPFRNNPPPPAAPIPVPGPDDDDDDEELRKALEMSKEGMGIEPVDEQRKERERSVRASGVPPPSPESEEGQVAGTLFGPTEKDDKDGSMAMVPVTLNQASTNNEDDDLNRAIADSLMTASFHSASAIRDTEKPIPGKRAEEAPLVLYSQSGNSTYAANVLQGLLAIPQLREAITASILKDSADAKTYLKMTYLQELIERSAKEENSFIEIDQTLREIRDGSEPTQLPPHQPSLDLHSTLVNLVQQSIQDARDNGSVDRTRAADDYWTIPHRLFSSIIDKGDGPTTEATFVRFHRQHGSPLDLSSALGGILWTPDSSNQSIQALSDILTVRILWDYGAPRELWKLEEKVVLDRFLKANASRSFQIRAQQNLALGNARRIKEKVEKVVTFKGQNLLDSLSALVKHYDSYPKTDDEIQNQSRSEMKAKLEKTLATLEAHKLALEQEREKEESAAGGGVFETDDPALNQHTFILRAILFHDGALVAGQHLYAYIRTENGSWWKVQEHEATPVEWDSIITDKTGLYMDGGPYMLLYSREGPRPAEESDSSSGAITPDTPVSATATETAQPKSETMEGVESSTLAEQEVKTTGTATPDLISLDEDEEPATAVPQPPTTTITGKDESSEEGHPDADVKMS